MLEAVIKPEKEPDSRLEEPLLIDSAYSLSTEVPDHLTSSTRCVHILIFPRSYVISLFPGIISLKYPRDRLITNKNRYIFTIAHRAVDIRKKGSNRKSRERPNFKMRYELFILYGIISSLYNMKKNKLLLIKS